MKIPSTMATQHPDSASRYIPIQEEAAEAAEALTPQPEGLGIEELMIDFEGKMTPYHQTAEIAHRLLDKGLVPGVDVALTPRVSNATEETVFRQLMALMSIIEADYDIAKSAPQGIIEEVILPMVKGATDLVQIRRRIADITELAHKEFGLERDPNALQVIALIEGVPPMLNFVPLYREYLSQAAELGFKQKRLRFMIGRSDSALSYGLVPAVLAAKIMIADAHILGEELDIVTAPILGGGALPFRGHITVENLDNVLADFAGVRTVTIQSGIRYDQDSQAARSLVVRLGNELAQTVPPRYSQSDREFINNSLAIFALSYIKVFDRIVAPVTMLADVIPQQRDRLTRRGPGGYSRPAVDPSELEPFATDSALKSELRSARPLELTSVPRAISFTAALYSVGLPPEFLGLADGIKRLIEMGGREALDRLLILYPGLKSDIVFAGRFLHLSVAERFFDTDLTTAVRGEIDYLETELNMDLTMEADKSYQTLLEIVEPLVRQTARGEAMAEEDTALLRSCMIRLGKLRGSLG